MSLRNSFSTFHPLWFQVSLLRSMVDPMKKPFFSAVAIAVFAISSVQADIVIIDSISPRNAGPGVADVSFGAGFAVNTHAANPLTINVAVANQDGDGDGSTDDSFSFDLTFTTPNTNGISLWGQGTNISNAAGTNTSFGNLGDLTVSVSNVVGTNSAGEAFVFDGFTGLTLASGDGSPMTDTNPGTPATQNRTIDFNGTTASFDNTGNTAIGFVFLQQFFDFSATPTLVLDNQGVANSGAPADGTLVIRELDFQFSTVAVPEPSSATLIALGLTGLTLIRRRNI